VEHSLSTEFERIVIIGSGSSFNAGVMAKPLIEKVSGLEVTVVVPMRMDDLRYISSKKVLHCILSQGGRSTNTLQVIRKLKKPGNPVIAVTEMEDSPIAQQAELTLNIQIGKENIGAKTKGVTATALILMLAFLGLGKYRPVEERAVKFLRRITENLTTLDARAFDGYTHVNVADLAPLLTFAFFSTGEKIENSVRDLPFTRPHAALRTSSLRWECVVLTPLRMVLNIKPQRSYWNKLSRPLEPVRPSSPHSL
jgi:fructoselysine-6-P-deglycase FrlB-like protein